MFYSFKGFLLGGGGGGVSTLFIFFQYSFGFVQQEDRLKNIFKKTIVALLEAYLETLSL